MLNSTSLDIVHNYNYNYDTHRNSFSREKRAKEDATWNTDAKQERKVEGKTPRKEGAQEIETGRKARQEEF